MLKRAGRARLGVLDLRSIADCSCIITWHTGRIHGPPRSSPSLAESLAGLWALAFDAVGVTALSLEPLEEIGLADAGDLTRGAPGWLLSRTHGFHERA
jgi:hypothetical protein